MHVCVHLCSLLEQKVVSEGNVDALLPLPPKGPLSLAKVSHVCLWPLPDSDRAFERKNITSSFTEKWELMFFSHSKALSEPRKHRGKDTCGFCQAQRILWRQGEHIQEKSHRPNPQKSEPTDTGFMDTGPLLQYVPNAMYEDHIVL